MGLKIVTKKLFWKSIIPVIGENFGKKTPLDIIHHINFECNLNCKYCGFPAVASKELTTTQIKQAIQEFSSAGTTMWNFCGGEPLLRKDLGQLIDFAKECGIDDVTLNTNGLLYKKRRNELENIDKILISLDGPKNAHEKMRGNCTFNKIVEAVSLAKDDNKDVTIVSVLSNENMKNNYSGLKYLFEFARKNDIRISFNLIYSHQFNKHFIKKYTPEINMTVNSLKLIEEFEKITGLLNRPLSLYGTLRKILEGQKIKIKSFAGTLYCDLMPDGMIVPCIFNLNEGISGVKLGFLNAFNMLKNNHICNSLYSCHFDRDLYYSLNLNSIFKMLNKNN